MKYSESWTGGLAKLGNFFSSPVTCLCFSVGGVLFGLLLPEKAGQFSLCGELYLNYMKLLSIPFLVSMLMISIANLVKQGNKGTTHTSLKKMLVVLFVSVFTASLFTYCASAFIYRVIPIQVNMENLDALLSGDKSNQHDVSLRLAEYAQQPVHQAHFSVGEFIRRNLPENFYYSLEQGNIIQLLICSVLFGIALGALNNPFTNKTIYVLNAVINH